LPIRTVERGGAAGSGNDWHDSRRWARRRGRTLYALDVTNPVRVHDTEWRCCAARVLWEFTDSVGYVRLADAVKTRRFGWVVLSASGAWPAAREFLYVLNQDRCVVEKN
jgi:Tfp pilus tip-associated adhesin PilY1